MLQQAWGSPEFSYLILNRFDLTLVLDFLVELVYRLWIFFFFSSLLRDKSPLTCV